MHVAGASIEIRDKAARHVSGGAPTDSVARSTQREPAPMPPSHNPGAQGRDTPEGSPQKAGVEPFAVSVGNLAVGVFLWRRVASCILCLPESRAAVLRC